MVELNELEDEITNMSRHLETEELQLKSYHSKTQLHDTWMRDALSKLEESNKHKNDIEFNIQKQKEYR